MTRKCVWCGRWRQPKDVLKLVTAGNINVCAWCFFGDTYDLKMFVEPWLRTGAWKAGAIFPESLLLNITAVEEKNAATPPHEVGEDDPPCRCTVESVGRSLSAEEELVVRAVIDEHTPEVCRRYDGTVLSRRRKDEDDGHGG